MKQFLDQLAQLIFLDAKEINGIKVDAWYLGRFVFVLAGCIVAIVFVEAWVKPKCQEWGKRRFGERSWTYRFWFISPFDKIPTFSLPDHLSRQQLIAYIVCHCSPS